MSEIGAVRAFVHSAEQFLGSHAQALESGRVGNNTQLFRIANEAVELARTAPSEVLVRGDGYAQPASGQIADAIKGIRRGFENYGLTTPNLSLSGLGEIVTQAKEGAAHLAGRLERSAAWDAHVHG
ncbi:MAG: hypothetical protein KDC46_02185 [Thermoleophilia bacterium]|nr:hypothetical protein [Thermoleophilia bacterium]